MWSKEPLSIQNALEKYLLGPEGVLGAQGGCSLWGGASWSFALCSGSLSCLVCSEMLIFLPLSLIPEPFFPQARCIAGGNTEPRQLITHQDVLCSVSLG